jgi:RNA-directed DNA polymerase
MQLHHPEKPFECYADDIIVHCKTERQAQFMLARIRERMAACGLTLHPEKTSIVNLRGKSEKRYPRKYDFLGFTLRPVMREINGHRILMPGTFVSGASKTAIRRKFKGLEIHKRRKPKEELARELNPVIEGIIQYFHKFWNAGMRPVWNQLNHRLLKWVKWEKGLFKYASLHGLRRHYRNNPQLFAHWRLVQHDYIWSCEREHEEPCEGRLSRTVLWEGRGEIPLSDPISSKQTSTNSKCNKLIYKNVLQKKL